MIVSSATAFVNGIAYALFLSTSRWRALPQNASGGRVKAAEKYLEYAATDPEFFRKHEEDFQDLIDTCGEFGYGVADELEMRFDGLQFELFGDEAD